MDLSADYLLFDDPLTVYYRPKAADGDPLDTRSLSAFVALSDTVEVDYAQRNAVDRNNTADAAWLQKDATVFHLWKARCPAGFLPRPDDLILSGSEFWVVREVGYYDRDANGVQRYRLVCEKSKGKVSP